jgi:hypothetical protein
MKRHFGGYLWNRQESLFIFITGILVDICGTGRKACLFSQSTFL